MKRGLWVLALLPALLAGTVSCGGGGGRGGCCGVVTGIGRGTDYPSTTLGGSTVTLNMATGGNTTLTFKRNGRTVVQSFRTSAK